MLVTAIFCYIMSAGMMSSHAYCSYALSNSCNHWLSGSHTLAESHGLSKPLSISSYSVRSCRLAASSSPVSPSSDSLPNPISNLFEVDVHRKIRTALTYDPHTGRYISIKPKTGTTTALSNTNHRIINLLQRSFLPEGVTPSYHIFIRWRITQRFISAVLHVLGTQSLLLSLGMNNGHRAVGLSAALNWVLKDALGKIVRMVWASKMGRKFDSDAKRWRYRSSLLYALGNGLEIGTFLCPSLFLLLATCANACKQMAMLTNSATRNALYTSFRDGTRENIGDITAKGEAQIAVVDLLGILCGVCLSRSIGISFKSILGVWVTLQALEVGCVYKSIRCVEFKLLNFERLSIITERFLSLPSLWRDEVNSLECTKPSAALPSRSKAVSYKNIPTPSLMARNEKIFLSPHYLARKEISFGSLGRTVLSPDEVSSLMKVFRDDKFLLIVGEDVKNKRKWRRRDHIITTTLKMEDYTNLVDHLKKEARANCHIVLHVDAENSDIVKSTLALSILRRNLLDSVPTEEEFIRASNVDDGNHTLALVDSVRMRRSGDSIDLIQQSKKQADNLFMSFVKALTTKGWATPESFMLGRVSKRADWPILGSGSAVKNADKVNQESIGQSKTPIYRSTLEDINQKFTNKTNIALY